MASERPDYWPDDADLSAFPTPRAMARAFVTKALDAGESPEDIPNLVFRWVPGAGPDMGEDVLAEIRGLEQPMEGFM